MKNISILPDKIIREPLFSLMEYNCIPKKEEELNEFIDSLFVNEKFAEAVYLSSPNLYSEWKKVVTKKKERGKINESILKFFLRSISNTVPFGLFTSYSTGITSKYQKEIKYERFSSIDLEYLISLVNYLNQQLLVINVVEFRRNNTIYKVGDKFRYIEPKFSDGKINYTLSSIDSDELIEYLLSYNNDKISFNELRLLILNLVEGVEEEEVYSYLLDLIYSKIYLSSFEIKLNEEDPLNQVIEFFNDNEDKIKTDESLTGIFISLKKVQNTLLDLDTNVFNSVDAYKVIFAELNKIGIPFHEKYVINSNLKKVQERKIENEKLDSTLNKLMVVLSRISKKNNGENTNLGVFKKNFYNRYEDKEVSLVLALDNELGIGYLPHLENDVVFSDLIDDINTPMVEKTISEKLVETSVYNFWLNLLFQNSKKSEIDLEKVDLSDFDKLKEVRDGSFSISYSCVNDKLFLKNIGGVTGTNLIGRFSNSDIDIQEIVNKVTNFEKSQYKNKIVGEIIHLPNNRAGNILIRKVNRDAEISLISKASDKSEVIDVNDLFISLRGNRIVLRSKKENKEVIPFLSSAQNFHFNSLPIYHFLCDLQSQDRTNDFSINYGGFNIGDLNYCPRIAYGEDLVLRNATWLLKSTDYRTLSDLKRDLIEKRVPVHFYITVEGEDKMIIDSSNLNMLNILYQEVERNKVVRITECIYNMSETTPQCFANEYVGFVQSQKKLNVLDDISFTEESMEKNISNVKRTFIYGDEWIYFKLYTGRITSDQILIENISKIVVELKSKGIIDKWFFIRFTDPDFHLRLRFHLKDVQKYSDVSKVMYRELSILLEENKIWKLELSTYNRELERYHWKNIENSEKIFYIDSEYTINMLRFLKENDENRRWLYVLKSIDDFFNAFKVNLVDRHKIISRMFTSFWIEHGEVKTIKTDVNNKFREFTTEIDDILNDCKGELKELYDRRFNELKNIQFDREIKKYLDDLLWSYIHMHINRFIQANPRLHELIMYGILERYYNRKLGIQKYNQKLIENEAY